MPNLTLPPKSTLLKILLAVLFLVIGTAAGTFSYLGFVELQQLNESITQDRERLALLESAPTPTPHPSTHPYSLTYRYPRKHPADSHPCTHVERSVHANQALRGEGGNYRRQRDRLGL